jgi:hypothetical protein
MTKNEFYDCVMAAYKPGEVLIKMVPADKLAWRPQPNFMSLGQLICHLSAGMGEEMGCMLTGKWPFTGEQMGEMMKLENLPSCDVAEALSKLEKDKTALRELLDGLSEDAFTNQHVSTPWGWQGKLETMAILFREHFTNHKMQLFTYLKLLGLPVDTSTLYGG